MQMKKLNVSSSGVFMCLNVKFWGFLLFAKKKKLFRFAKKPKKFSTNKENRDLKTLTESFW